MIYIIRHGQTEKNRAKLLQGRSDTPLNEEGRRQAAEAGKKLREAGARIDLVYSSPLQRAVETAAIVTRQTSALISGGKASAPQKSVPVRIDSRLIEMDYGPYEGTDMTNLPPEIMYFFSDFVNHPAPEGMEQLPDVVGRLGAFLEEIRETASKKNILISTHAIAMKGALEYLTPDSRGSYWNKYIGNCEVYAAETGTGGYGIPRGLFLR